MCEHRGVTYKWIQKTERKLYRRHIGTLRKCKECGLYVGDKSLLYHGDKFSEVALKLLIKGDKSKLEYYGLLPYSGSKLSLEHKVANDRVV